MTKQNYKPEGYATVTAYLTVQNAKEAIAWYQKVFGAEVITMMEMGPIVGHAELKIGDSIVMLSDEGSGGHGRAPRTLGGVSSFLVLYVPSCDEVYHRALQNGASNAMQPKDEFYGDRVCGVRDPFGHFWGLHTNFEMVSPEEMQKRMAKLAGK